MSMIKWLDKHTEETILIFLLGIIVLLSGVQVVMRYVFNNSLVWSEELCRYCYVWTGFISIAFCIKHGGTIRIDTFVNFLPKAAKTAMLILTTLISIAVFAFLLKNAMLIVAKSIASGQTSPALKMPMYFLYLGPVSGFILAEIRLLQNAVVSVIGFSNKKEG